MSHSRYKSFINDGKFKKVPFIEIPKTKTDCYTHYKKDSTRMDLLSYQYYDDPNYGWLIMQANPSIGSLEFSIEDDTRIRIPYPLENAIQMYEDGIKRYEKLYGIN